MKFNAKNHLDVVKRLVSSVKRDGQTACAVTLSRNFETRVEDLWAAVTNKERIPRWFLPISGDLKLGGRYQLEGNAGGTITACKQSSHFALTWEFAGDTSWVEVHFSDEGTGHSGLSLTHTMFLSEHWNKYGPGATGVGWDLILLGIWMHLTYPTEPKPDEVAFATSSEGQVFITGSSEAWGQAAIAAGTDPKIAHAAAERTTAFYTGASGET